LCVRDMLAVMRVKMSAVATVPVSLHASWSPCVSTAGVSTLSTTPTLSRTKPQTCILRVTNKQQVARVVVATARIAYSIGR